MTLPKQKPPEPRLHRWVREPKSEPLRCAKCGCYYTEAKAWDDCPANREAA